MPFNDSIKTVDLSVYLLVAMVTILTWYRLLYNISCVTEYLCTKSKRFMTQNSSLILLPCGHGNCFYLATT